MRAQAATLAPGLVLEQKYRIERHLADGGMGAIYEAQHLTLGKRVAVKVLHAEFARKPEIVARFQQEARAASAIGHQHIVDILDLGCSADGQYFLIMELLSGQNLGVRLGALGGRMPVGRACHVMTQVLDALAATHRHGIVHRDLKPENIFLIQRGGDLDFVKVLDFGISKVLTDDLPKMSTTGQVLGTPYFMSPEQTRGAATDHRADIYACGAILYQLVTGKLPFTAPNFNALMFEIAGGRYYPPRSIVPELPVALEQVIQYAMALDPAYRYQSAEHMMQAVAPLARAELVPGAAGSGSGAASAIDDGESRTPSALQALMPPPPELGTAPVMPSRPSPGALQPAPRSKALPLTIGAGIAVGVFAGLLVIRGMDRGKGGGEGAAGAGSDTPTARVVPSAPEPPPKPPEPKPEPEPEPVAKPPEPPPAEAEPVVEAVADAAPPQPTGPVVTPVETPPKPEEPPKEKPKPEPVVPVKLTVVVSPADAADVVISVDGAPAPGGVATVPAGKSVKVVVKAKGYETAVKRVKPAGDESVEITLKRKKVTGGPGGALGL